VGENGIGRFKGDGVFRRAAAEKNGKTKPVHAKTSCLWDVVIQSLENLIWIS